MNEHDVADIDKHVRAYMMVFGALLFLTLVTVGVAYIDFSVPVAIAVALVIASIKGTLVACYFMHLISERKLIYWIIGLTVLLFGALLLLPVLTSLADQVMS